MRVNGKGGDACEWNPATKRPATNLDPWHSDAEFVVGHDGQWRLCAECAALRCFARLKKRMRIVRRPEP